MTKTRWCVALGLALGSVGLGADTLVLRDGRRVEGQLIAVTDRTVEWRDSTRSGRTQQFDRSDVRAIEFDDRGVSRQPDRSASRPRGLREKEVIVSGDVPFVDAGIEVQAGQRLYFESVGNVWWRRNRKDGPAGSAESDYNAKRPLPRRPTAALIGKIGHDSTEWFFIGDDPGPLRMQGSGRLFLGVNDDYFEDNHGNFRVLVFY